MNANTAKALFGGLLPFITNPATLAIIGIGAVGITVYGMLSEDKEKTNKDESQPGTVPNGYEPLQEPLTRAHSTVPATVGEPLETVAQTVQTTVGEPFNKDRESHSPSDEPDSLSEENVKKEMIRQTMSELGKRSGAARRRKSQTAKIDSSTSD